MLTAKDFQLQYGNSSITFVFQTPLHLAVITHQKYLVEKLVEGGADVNLMDRHGQTALHLACQNGDIHSVLAIRDVTHRCHMQIRLDLKNFQGEHITTVPRRAAVDWSSWSTEPLLYFQLIRCRLMSGDPQFMVNLTLSCCISAMDWIRRIVRQALHRPHGSLAVCLKHKKLNWRGFLACVVVSSRILFQVRLVDTSYPLEGWPRSCVLFLLWAGFL